MTAVTDGSTPVVVDGAETEPKPVDTAQFIQDSADSAGRRTFMTGLFVGTGLSTITNWIVERASCGGFDGWLLVPTIGAGLLALATLSAGHSAVKDRKRTDDVVEIAVQQARLSTKPGESQVVSPHDLLMRTEHEVFGAKVTNFVCGFALGWGVGSALSGHVMRGQGLSGTGQQQFAPYIAQSGLGVLVSIGGCLADMKRRASLKMVFAFSRKSDNTCG